MVPQGGAVEREPETNADVLSRRLFLSHAERARPVHVRSALIATLFGSATNVATLAFAAMVCGWLAYTRSGCILSVAVAVLETLDHRHTLWRHPVV